MIPTHLGVVCHTANSALAEHTTAHNVTYKYYTGLGMRPGTTVLLQFPRCQK